MRQRPEAQGRVPLLVFVVGCPRSGTTWVLDILDSHGSVAAATPEQLGLIDTYPPGSKESQLLNGEAYTELVKGLRNVLPEGRAASMAYAVAGVLFGDLARRTGASVIVEKTPTNIFRAEEIAEYFPGCKFIHVLRDGRDVCASLLAAHEAWGRAWAPSTVEDAAELWRRSVEAAREMERALPGERRLTVRYEDLFAEPVPAIQEMFSFLGISVSPSEAGQIEKRNARGARAWFPGVFRKGIVGDWKERFGPAELARFHAVAGTELVRLGYEKDGSWLPPDRVPAGEATETERKAEGGRQKDEEGRPHPSSLILPPSSPPVPSPALQPAGELEAWHGERDPWDFEGTPDDLRRRTILLSEIPDRDYERVLDIGCGQGFITRHLPGRHVTGVDVSHEAVRKAREHEDDRLRRNLKYLQCSLFDLARTLKARFDLIVITGVLYPHYIGNALSLVYRVVDELLEDSGILLSVHIDRWYRARFPYLLVRSHYYAYREHDHCLEVYVK